MTKEMFSAEAIFLFHLFDKAIIGMSLLRFLSGMIEVTVAILFLKLNDVGKALILNSSLALVGPMILIATTAIGLFGIAEKVSMTRIAMIFTGVILIILGVKGR
jgi:hypothetical protein